VKFSFSCFVCKFVAVFLCNISISVQMNRILACNAGYGASFRRLNFLSRPVEDSACSFLIHSPIRRMQFKCRILEVCCDRAIQRTQFALSTSYTPCHLQVSVLGLWEVHSLSASSAHPINLCTVGDQLIGTEISGLSSVQCRIPKRRSILYVLEVATRSVPACRICRPSS
jgi:hypothetical protein